ncbi:acyltransferase [Leclercia sp. W6]|uniref:acyltransferase family protein n=1 Tax=Leclercia sp. W6 TaxID=2282310 RepID=UPI000DF25CA8|nr:acyltransferase [Leclercia sp. W6]AXF59266.1 acyltransferase [Leclercia sp. W6]
MDYVLYNLMFLVCIILAIYINSLLCRVNFYDHIDFSGRRYFHLDGIRGLAALFVVMNHAVFSFANNGFTPDEIDTSNFWIFAHAGDTGVQIFFSITGFLFFDKIIKTNNNIDWGGFFQARVKRLVPMYIMATTIVAILTLLWSQGQQSPLTTLRQLINIYGFGFLGSDIWVNGFRTYSLNAVIWTLPYEWRFYCILPVICTLIRYKRLFYFSFVLAFLYALNDLYTGQVVWVYFISGAAAAIVNNTAKLTLRKKTVAIDVISSFAVIICLIYLLNCDLSGYGFERFTIISILFIFIIWLKPGILTLRPLVYLGEASYSSYLLHLIVNALVIKSLSSLTDLNKASPLLFWCVIASLVGITTLLTAYTFKYIEYKFLKK